MRYWSIFLLLFTSLGFNSPHFEAKYIVLLIGDGYGYNHQEAVNAYTGSTPAYQSWHRYWVSTFPNGGSYDPDSAWTDFDYVKQNATDSAAAATAIFTGNKTDKTNISIGPDGSCFTSIVDEARSLGKATGTASSVYISHATPGAWLAHNEDRNNGYAIAAESLWGNPTTTMTTTVTYYEGGICPVHTPADVVLGAGHPKWEESNFVNWAIRDKLAGENGLPGEFTFIERIEGTPDAGSRLTSIANDPDVYRLAGLFGGSGGNLDYRLADGTGYDPENPTLSEMTDAALKVLNRNSNGFVLMVEGGAIDWAGHANKMDEMIGEAIDFNTSVQTVIDWIDDPSNGSNWQNTLVIVTADHETGYLNANYDSFPNQPPSQVISSTLALEKAVSGTSTRASWEDEDADNLIDEGEQVYWAWHTTGHSNSLVPLYAKGHGAGFFSYFSTNSEPERGDYLDNTNIYQVMHWVLEGYTPYNIFLPGVLKTSIP